MQIHPSELQVFVEDRHRTIALQAHQARGSHVAKITANGQSGWLPGWLSLAGLQELVRSSPRADRSAPRSRSVRPSKPQEQCC